MFYENIAVIISMLFDKSMVLIVDLYFLVRSLPYLLYGSYLRYISQTKCFFHVLSTFILNFQRIWYCFRLCEIAVNLYTIALIFVLEIEKEIMILRVERMYVYYLFGNYTFGGFSHNFSWFKLCSRKDDGLVINTLPFGLKFRYWVFL